MDENLLIANFRKVKLQEENYTTEAFASLLRYLVRNERWFSFGLFNLLTQRKFNSMNFEPNEIIIRTQTTTDSGRPDIEIFAPDFLIYIENKVEARLERNQIERYKSALENSGNTNTLLILISKYRMKFQEYPDIYIRWFEIAEWIEREINQLKSNEAFTKVAQFLEFLRYRYLAPDPATTRVAPSLKKYLQREGKDSLTSRYITRSSRLGEDPDLIPLRKLLNVMAFSIERTFPVDNFGFINSTWGRKRERTATGFNIEYRYDFFININQSDILLFRATMRSKLKPNPKLGHGKLLRVGHIVYWIAKLKLTDKNISFFSKSFDKQVALLSNFMKKGRTIVDRLDPNPIHWKI